MTNPSMDTTSHFARVVNELCSLVGFKHPEILLKGGKLLIGEHRVSFVDDAALAPKDKLLVYIDMGPPQSESKEDAYKTLLKINFQLLAGTRGAISLHPETGHVFYSFSYALHEQASGRALLDHLIRFIADIGIEALRLPQDLKEQQGNASVTGRSRAERFLAQNDNAKG